MKCPNCSNECNEKNAFCPFCGTKIEVPIVKEKICPHCGESNNEEDRFCKKCGYYFELTSSKINTNNKSSNNNVSLILSIIAIALTTVCCVFPFVSQGISIILAIISLVLNKKENKNTPAMVIAIIAIVISCFIVFCYIISYEEIYAMLQEILQTIENGEIEM